MKLWEKGTNRSAFFKGEIDKYGWVDIGSSFLPSEIIAAFLFAQLEQLDSIQKRRKEIWELYVSELGILEKQNLLSLPIIPEYATNNAHMFYIVTENLSQRDELLKYLKLNNIHAVFHYISLHSSQYYLQNHTQSFLPQADRYTSCLIRLPLFYELKDEEVVLKLDEGTTRIARDRVMRYLSNLKLQDVMGEEAKTAIATAIQERLMEAVGEESVKSVYFAEFVVQ